jgi:hypothetical protein
MEVKSTASPYKVIAIRPWTGGTSCGCLFFEGAHYERVIAAMPRARTIMQSA